MERRALRIWRVLAALLCLLAGQAALAVPIEVEFHASDGSATGRFAFEPRQVQDNPATLAGGWIEVGGRLIEGTRLFYEYYPIADSLTVRIAGDETSGLDAGDFLNLTFGNPDGSSLLLPTRGFLSYTLGGVSGSATGTVSAVPEPMAAGLFGGAVAALAWRRRRRRSTAAAA